MASAWSRGSSRRSASQRYIGIRLAPCVHVILTFFSPSQHSIPIKAPAPGAAINFALPATTLVPIKPPSIPPPPTAKKQSEVCEDFSKAKPGNQIQFNTFHIWAEAYLRPFGEDDLAFLAPRVGPATLTWP